jgi:hypothetical protein
MAIFNSYVTNYQRVVFFPTYGGWNPIAIPITNCPTAPGFVAVGYGCTNKNPMSE